VFIIVSSNVTKRGSDLGVFVANVWTTLVMPIHLPSAVPLSV
jgi:hypothetical protein